MAQQDPQPGPSLVPTISQLQYEFKEKTTNRKKIRNRLSLEELDVYGNVLNLE